MDFAFLQSTIEEWSTPIGHGGAFAVDGHD